MTIASYDSTTVSGIELTIKGLPAASSCVPTEEVGQPVAEGRSLRTSEACPHGRIGAAGLTNFRRVDVDKIVIP